MNDTASPSRKLPITLAADAAGRFRLVAQDELAALRAADLARFTCQRPGCRLP